MHSITKILSKASACRDGLQSKFCLVLGLQWGREGKRQLLNKLCVDYDYSCRFNGGKLSEPNILPNGEELNLMPVGIQYSNKTKSIIGNGVVIDAEELMNDLTALHNNGIEYKDRLFISSRTHLVTALHKRVAQQLRVIRNDTIWISGEDVAMAFKPLKMGLRMAHLVEQGKGLEEFIEKYMRIKNTYEELFQIKVTEQEINNDVEHFKMLYSILKEKNLVQDTVVLLNQKINAGKRILVEDCSSSSMDIDYGIYPYTDSFHTTTGQVCTGLGVPEEVIETTIGVCSCTSIIRKAFLNRIKSFPTQITEEDKNFEIIRKKLESEYSIDQEKYAFGWLDLNTIKHAHMLNRLSSVFITGLDILDEVDEIKICHQYKKGEEVIDGILPPLINDFEMLTPSYKIVKGWKAAKTVVAQPQTQNVQNPENQGQPEQGSNQEKDQQSEKPIEKQILQGGVSEVERFDDLPVNAQSFVREIEKLLKIPISYIGVNNEEEEGIIRVIR